MHYSLFGPFTFLWDVIEASTIWALTGNPHVLFNGLTREGDLCSEWPLREGQLSTLFTSIKGLKFRRTLIKKFVHHHYHTTCEVQHAQKSPVYKDQTIWVILHKWSLHVIAISLPDESGEIMLQRGCCRDVAPLYPIQWKMQWLYSFSYNGLCIQIQKHSLSKYNFFGINCSIPETTTTTAINLSSLLRQHYSCHHYYHCPETTNIVATTHNCHHSIITALTTQLTNTRKTCLPTNTLIWHQDYHSTPEVNV